MINGVGQQMNDARNDNNFDGYLIFDFHEFQGLISQPDSNFHDERSMTESKVQGQSQYQQQFAHQSSQIGQRTSNMNNNVNIGLNTSSSMPKFSSNQENVRKFSVYNQVVEDHEDDKKNTGLHIQGLDYLDKTKDKTNYDEFYMFLMGLDFLNINNTRNRVDPILMDQFKSLVKIKEYFIMLRNHMDKITENDSDLWFDELKNTFKLILHQFENMINSISEQINPVSLSVCFFRCIEQIKVFEQFLHMRAFHANSSNSDYTAVQKFRRSIQLCMLWKRVTGNKNYEKLIQHIENDPFNCQACDKCKRESRINMQLYPFKQSDTATLNLPNNFNDQNSPRQNQNNFRSNKSAYFNTKIFKDIQESFERMFERDLHKIKIYQRKKKANDPIKFNLADRPKTFRPIVSPICKSNNKTDFFLP